MLIKTKHMRKSLFFINLLLLVTLLYSCQGNKTIKWWSSTEKKKWEEQRNILWQDIDPFVTSYDIVIYPDSFQQRITGFGGCFNELGWDALNTLPVEIRENILKMLFDPQNDLRFNICRMPIGANDYSRDFYSLNDSANDYSMENFSLDRDKLALIPFIKSALRYNEKIKIWASPWTPPAWMKTNNHYACASGAGNGLKKTDQGKEGINQLIQNDTILLAYAKYFVKFVKEYKKEGIEISSVHVQNEFNSCQVFPSCIWTASALTNFIGNYLGPQFEKQKLKTEIWFGTIERPYIENIDTLLNDEKCNKYIKGLGFQWGGKGAIAEAHRKYPQLRLMQTENECGDGSNNWRAAEYTFSLMKHYLNYGANAYMYWNMVLEKSGKSHWGWRQNSLISIDSRKKKVVLNPEYYLFKHFSNLIRPGSLKVKTSGIYNDVLAFITPQNELVIIIANIDDSEKVLKIKVKKKTISVLVAPHSFNSLLCYKI